MSKVLSIKEMKYCLKVSRFCWANNSKFNWSVIACNDTASSKIVSGNLIVNWRNWNRVKVKRNSICNLLSTWLCRNKWEVSSHEKLNNCICGVIKGLCTVYSVSGGCRVSYTLLYTHKGLSRCPKNSSPFWSIIRVSLPRIYSYLGNMILRRGVNKQCAIKNNILGHPVWSNFCGAE